MRKKRFSLQLVAIMEACQSCEASSTEFCHEVDEFYNILETMSPFAAAICEVEVCSRCKSAPCSCSFSKPAKKLGAFKREASSAVAEDYPISGSSGSPLAVPKKARTVGIVEPRVVVRIPWTKIGGRKAVVNFTPDETAPDQHDGFRTITKRDLMQCNWAGSSGVKSPMGPSSNAHMVADIDGSSSLYRGDHGFLSPNLAKMKTNGSHNGHIQVDGQTIETALHDEVACAPTPFAVDSEEVEAEELHQSNEAGEIMRRKQQPLPKNRKEGQPDAAAELETLDSILDNFLITTSSAAAAEQLPNQMDVSNPSINSVKTALDCGSSSKSEDAIAKFTFEEDEDKQWMFCHVPGCSFWTSKSSRMERHKLCHTEPTELEVKRCYKCPDCHLKFYSLAKLLKHDRRKHTGVKDYECRICAAEVTDIQVHMRIHADEKHHYCEHCPLSFRHKSSLVRHMFLHTGERPYRCQSCQSSFTARDRLKGHILKHHPNHPAAQELLSLSKQSENQNEHEHVVAPKKQQQRKRKRKQRADMPDNPPPETRGDNNNQDFILQLPTNAYLQINPDGNLCWQQPPEFCHFDAGIDEDQQINPLDVAIKEIIATVEVPVVSLEPTDFGSQMTRFADKLKSLREQCQVPKDKSEKLYCCDKCGREYKYKSFLQVHQKRRCW